MEQSMKAKTKNPCKTISRRAQEVKAAEGVGNPIPGKSKVQRSARVPSGASGYCVGCGMPYSVDEGHPLLPMGPCCLKGGER